MVRLVFYIHIALTVACFILSLLSFLKKGIILDDHYIFASKEARKHMDKNAYYLQSAVVFLALGIIFLLGALRFLFHATGFPYEIVVIGVIAIIYAIISHYAIRKKQGK